MDGRPNHRNKAAAIARSILQGLSLRFSRNKRTVEVIKLFIIWLKNCRTEKKNYSSGSRQFRSGDAGVY